MNGKNRGKLYVVGFGPGHYDHMTNRAREAIRDSDVIVGYNTYVEIIRGLLDDQEIVQTCPHRSQLDLDRTYRLSTDNLCTNVPISCPFCPEFKPDGSMIPAVWKYNIEAHIRADHPEVEENLLQSSRVTQEEFIAMNIRLISGPSSPCEGAE